MRLWLRASERRPAPEPVITNDRAAIIAGTVFWLVALVVLLILRATTAGASDAALVTALIGIGLGLLGLVYVRFRRRS